MVSNHEPGPLLRTIKDLDGTVWRLWEFEPKPGRYGSAYCFIGFSCDREQRYLLALRGSLHCEHHNSLVLLLKSATRLPAGRQLPGPVDLTQPPRTLSTGDYEEGA